MVLLVFGTLRWLPAAAASCHAGPGNFSIGTVLIVLHVIGIVGTWLSKRTAEISLRHMTSFFFFNVGVCTRSDA